MLATHRQSRKTRTIGARTRAIPLGLSYCAMRRKFWPICIWLYPRPAQRLIDGDLTGGQSSCCASASWSDIMSLLERLLGPGAACSPSRLKSCRGRSCSCPGEQGVHALRPRRAAAGQGHRSAPRCVRAPRVKDRKKGSRITINLVHFSPCLLLDDLAALTLDEVTEARGSSLGTLLRLWRSRTEALAGRRP